MKVPCCSSWQRAGQPININRTTSRVTWCFFVILVVLLSLAESLNTDMIKTRLKEDLDRQHEDMLSDSPYLSTDFLEFISSESSGERFWPLPHHNQVSWKQKERGPKKHKNSKKPVKSWREMEAEYSQPACPFIRIFHPAENCYLQVLPDGTISTTTSQHTNQTLFQLMPRYDGVTILENVHTCSVLCMNKSGYLFTLPLNEQDKRCHFETHVKPANETTVADTYALSSVLYRNATHRLTLALHKMPIEGPKPFHFRWTGEWIAYTSMSDKHNVNLIEVAFSHVRQVVPHTILHLVYRSYNRLKDYCPYVKLQKSPVSIKKSWDDRFMMVHQNCELRRSVEGKRGCRKQNRKRCLHEARKLGRLILVDTCVFLIDRGKDESGIYKGSRSKKCWSRGLLKSERKVCLKRQRKKCRNRVAKRNPNWPPKRVKHECKRKRKVEKCIHNAKVKAKRKRKAFNKQQAKMNCSKLKG